MDTIALTMREQQRVAVVERVFRGELTMAEVAMVLGVSERQSFRIKARIRKEGVRGVIHGNRGRSSPRKLPGNTHHRIVALARGKYRGFNDHHLTEKLADTVYMRTGAGSATWGSEKASVPTPLHGSGRGRIREPSVRVEGVSRTQWIEKLVHRF